jgi:hypothetical protein
MAYATTADAGFRITSVTHNAVQLKGAVRATVERIVEREILQSEAENTPVSRPLDRLDARAVFAVLDGSGLIGHAATAGNCVVNFSEADGGSGAVTVGPMLANGWTGNFARNQGGHQYEQEFVFQGNALTETLTF